MATAQRPTRSLKHEYELYVEQEVENYKNLIPRSQLLSIADEAVAILLAAEQATIAELVLTAEVDRLIIKRLQLPTFRTWCRLRLKRIAELRRREHWGFGENHVLVRALPSTGDGHVLVAGAENEASVLYFAANGCEVTALDTEFETVERMTQAAVGAGLGSRIHAPNEPLASWVPDLPLNAVIVNLAALDGLSKTERARVIEVLQSATADGGVHLVQTIVSSAKASGAASLEELRNRYVGWQITVERNDSGSKTLLARKGVA
jgi:hypothetical protein